MTNKISADEISTWLTKLEFESVPQGTAGFVEFNVTLRPEGVPEALIEYDGGQEELKIVNVNSANMEIVSECLRQADMLPMGMQLHTGMLKPRSQKHFDVDILGQWLTEIMNAWLTDRVYLVPDTNFLVRRYGSNHVLTLTNKFKDFSLCIPRLAILEIESLATRKGRDRQLEKRRAFLALAEVIRLRENGAELLPRQIDPVVMETFSKIAGEGYADAWIRREVHDFVEQLPGGKPLEHRPKVFFLTSDLLNAFAAVAEGIDTIYFWETDSTNEGYRANARQVGRFAVAMSVFFEKILMQTKSKKSPESYELVGLWSGKTIEDWKNDLVQISKKGS
jgi:hypothetical protein